MHSIRKHMLYWITLGSYLFVLGFYLINFTGLQMVTDRQYLSIILAIIMIVILIITILTAIEHVDDLNQDKRYQVFFLVVNILFLIVFIRTQYDNSIVSVYLNNYYKDSNSGMRYLFLNENLPIFIILYTCIIAYQSTYLKKKGKRKNGRKH